MRTFAGFLMKCNGTGYARFGRLTSGTSGFCVGAPKGSRRALGKRGSGQIRERGRRRGLWSLRCGRIFISITYGIYGRGGNAGRGRKATSSWPARRRTWWGAFRPAERRSRTGSPDATTGPIRFGAAPGPDPADGVGPLGDGESAGPGLGETGDTGLSGPDALWHRDSEGRVSVGAPARKRGACPIRHIRAALRRRWLVDPHENARWWGPVVRGGLHDYAVPGSFRFLSALVYGVKYLLLRALRRRSQKDRTTAEPVERWVPLHGPRVHILHPWPDQRRTV